MPKSPAREAGIFILNIMDKLKHVFGLLVNRDIYLKRIFFDIPLIDYLEDDNSIIPKGATKEILIKHAQKVGGLTIRDLNNKSYIMDIKGIGSSRAESIISRISIVTTKYKDIDDYPEHLYYWVYKYYL